MGKSIEQVQNSTLSQFGFAANGNQNQKMIDYMEISKQKRKDFEEKFGNREIPLLKRGYSAEALQKIQDGIKRKEEQKNQQVQRSIENKNRHSLLNSVLEVFGTHDRYTPEILKEFNKQEDVLLDTDNLLITMKCGKCLSYSMKIQVTVSAKKEYYKKSDTFEQDGKIITDFKWVDETINFTAKYGSILDFRRSLLPNFNPIIEKYSIDDKNSIHETNENIWEFHF